MTTFNPSHNPFRKPQGRHAQAVHRPSPEPSDVDSDDEHEPGSSSFPDDLPSNESDSESGEEHQRARRQGRGRVKASIPPLPDLRFEQSYLLSIRPYLQPRPTRAAVQEKGNVPSGKGDSNSLVESAHEDAVFHWGRDVDVNWRMVVYITLRDQLFSPLVQGALWGWGTLFLTATGVAMRASLYPPSHVSNGRILGGPGGSIEAAGGGSAVGGTEWWRKWVQSWGGAVETAVV